GAIHGRSGRPFAGRRLQGAGADPPDPVRLCHPRPFRGRAAMTGPFQNHAELGGLLDALCEETITPEQLRRLEELVLSHPEAEKHYIQFMNLHANVIGHVAGLPAPKPVCAETPAEAATPTQPLAEPSSLSAPKSEKKQRSR